jgi:hypothetical protein
MEINWPATIILIAIGFLVSHFVKKKVLSWAIFIAIVVAFYVLQHYALIDFGFLNF